MNEDIKNDIATESQLGMNGGSIEQDSSEMTPKKGKAGIIILIVLLLAVGAGAYVFFGTDLLKKDKEDSKTNESANSQNALAEKFEGIYRNGDDKIFIRKQEDGSIKYMINGNYSGFAKVNGNVAKENTVHDDYFEFTLNGSDIELAYHTDEDVDVLAELGKYTRVADYNQDNIYKEAVGDPSYLNTKYSGLYASGNIKLYLIQISDKKVMVKLSNDTDIDSVFDETFEIVNDSKLVAKSFFEENETAFELNFSEKSFSLKANHDVFGFHDEDEQLEKTYTFEKAITKEEILKEFYSDF